MGRREDKKLATRNLILDAAATLFPKVGYEQTSVDDIVREADVVKGTFYYHFTSKEEVLMALKTSAFRSTDFEKELENGKSPLLVLKDLLIEDARWTEANRVLAEVFFTRVFAKAVIEDHFVTSSDANAGAENTENGGSEKHTRKGPPAIVARLVEAAQAAGELRRDQHAEDLADVILGSFVHAQLTWLITKSQDSLIERVERWLEIVLQGCAQGSKQSLASQH